VNFPDTLIIEGRYQFKPDLPFSPGSEIAGTVAALGEGADGVAVGDRVMGMLGWGGFAEQVAAPASALVPVPDGMDLVTASGFTLAYATSYHALVDRGRLQEGETLLVLGAAGGVGLAAVQLGAALGARVIAGGLHGRQARAVPRARCRRDRELRHGRPARAAQGAHGRPGRGRRVRPRGRRPGRAGAALHRLARALPRGRLRSGRHPADPAQPDAAQGLRDRRRLLRRVRRAPARGRRPQRRGAERAVDRRPIRPVVSATYPLEEAARALEDIAARKVTGKVVVTTERGRAAAGT
jgi:NADPH2:quinone reductase